MLVWMLDGWMKMKVGGREMEWIEQKNRNNSCEDCARKVLEERSAASPKCGAIIPMHLLFARGSRAFRYQGKGETYFQIS
jgi:hypothetical protein